MMKTTISMVMVLGSVAFAQPSGGGKPGGPAEREAAAPRRVPMPTQVTGDKAKAMMRALKLAGAKSTKAKSKWTFTAKTMSCHSMAETDDALGSYDCQIDGKKFTNAAALVLHDGMAAAGIDLAENMSQTHPSVNALSCVDDQAATGGADAIYVCTFTPAH